MRGGSPRRPVGRAVEATVAVALALALVVITELELLGRYGPSGRVEVAAVVGLAASVWLAVRNSVWTWPTGIVATALYLHLFWEWRLFADAGLQAVYIVLGVLGMWAWLRRGRVPTRPQAERAGAVHLAAVIAAVALGTAVVTAYLARVGGSAPLVDALLTSGSLGAQYLLIRKYLESWYLWALVDVGYVALFLERGFYLSAVLYTGLLWMVVKAARDWRGLVAPPVVPQPG